MTKELAQDADSLRSLQPTPQLLAPTHLVTSKTVLFRKQDDDYLTGLGDEFIYKTWIPPHLQRPRNPCYTAKFFTMALKSSMHASELSRVALYPPRLDAFVDQRKLHTEGFWGLKEGQAVEFTFKKPAKGLESIRVLGPGKQSEESIVAVFVGILVGSWMMLLMAEG
ncbi:hypothetical protein Celaphus_00013581 [Cervus elaphus hippelaphus]|uniref:Uncharacterized protein n=1 Tax=Cervus elaphus hippelaphus TaxID=46360 RepID=A0A212DGU6_CEREH|nr:hypothetical protein Celaphus_00013581 [Cervus elaphus hippelaphus]